MTRPFALELPPLPPGRLQVLPPQAPAFTIERTELEAILSRSLLALRAALARSWRLERERARRPELELEDVALWLNATTGRAVALWEREALARCLGFWTEEDRYCPPTQAAISVPLDGITPLVVQLPHGLVMTCCDLPGQP